MKTALRTFCFATLSLLAAPVLSAADPFAKPQHFSAYIGGFAGRSYRVEMREGNVTYTRFGAGWSNPRQTTVKVTEAQWQEFRRTLDELKVWQWRREYKSNGVMDGSQWSLDIAYPDHALRARGDNNYPDAAGKPTGEPEPTKEFSRYLAAVEKLLGGKGFR